MRCGWSLHSSAAAKGYFVEVGANDPRERSQTWHLEQAGWTGVLIEPQPDLAAELRARRNAKVFAVACSSPENAGRELPLHVAGPLSSLDRRHMAPGATPERIINVPIRTLDSILAEAGTPDQFRFSVDRCRGPRNRGAARFRYCALAAAADPARGSRRRSVEASVPHSPPAIALSGVTKTTAGMCHASQRPIRQWSDHWEVLRKYYLALPFRVLRNLSQARSQTHQVLTSRRIALPAGGCQSCVSS